MAANLYLKPNSNWKQSNARFAAYFFGNGEKWVDMYHIGGDIYKCTVPDGYTKVIFCRMNPSASANDWNNKWNQTGDLTLPTNGNNLFTLSASAAWDGATTGWSKYSEPTWTVAGSSTALFGTEWDSSNEANNLVDENGIYTKTYYKVSLNSGTIEFKVCKDNGWSEAYPATNKTCEIKETGEYDITITFSASSKEVSIIAKKYFKVKEGGEYLFLKPNSDWKTDNARFALFYFGDGNEYWVSMDILASHQDEGVYYALMPKGDWAGFIFCRMNPNASANNWDNRWTQTADLVYDGTNNLFSMKEEESNDWKNEGDWEKIKNAPIDIVNGLAEGAYYGTMTYTMNFSVANKDADYWHWISLPYYVNISDIKGANDAPLSYGSDLVFKWYDTESRAKWEGKSASGEDETWKQLEVNEVLEAGRGYILGVGEKDFAITFKSAEKLHVVVDKVEGSNTQHESTDPINSNWHLIGTGVYGNVGEVENINYVAMPDETGLDYTYHHLSGNDYSIFTEDLDVSALEPYTAFFVQHGGGYLFSKEVAKSNAAPRRARAEEVVEQYYVNIAGATDTSYTAIFLAEDGSDEYVVGQDFLHFGASGASLQLYTLQSENTLSFNYLKREDRTVLVGGYVAQSGKYTISLDAEGDASSVTLYDATTGLVADLLNENYEFEAEKGTLDGRFRVIISYAAGDGPATMIGDNENESVVVSNNDGIAYFEGLSVGESVAVYDVMGRCVTQFVAENDEADVMLTSGVYMLYHNGETVKFVVNR